MAVEALTAALLATLATATPCPDAACELARHHVVLEPRPGGVPWPEELLRGLLAGLERIPPRHRGTGVVLRYSEVPAPFGMGEADAGRLTLHPYREPTEHRATYRLEGLSPADRERLWRQRAMVHAIVSKLDHVHGWSRLRAWRRLNGWLRPFERPLELRERALNHGGAAYSRSAGQRSAALDLVTFAEEALVPAETFASSTLSEEDQVRCQELSRSRVLRELGLLETPRGSCARFDGWLDLATLDEPEILFVAASGRAPESLFGHLMLRLQRRGADRVHGPGLQPAVQLVALTGGDLPGPLYARRGLTGGYPLVLMTTAMQDITRQMLEYEQRTIRRYRLRLSSEEKVRLMERLWELERRGRLDYRFLHDNCAFAVASSSMARWRRTGRCACPGASPRCSQRRRWMPSPW